MDDGIADGHLDVRILGPLEVRRGEALLPLGGHRQQAVLACLVVSKGFATTTDRIADAIWGESPPPGYLTTLQTYVYHLRAALEPGRARGAPGQVLATSAAGYRLVVPEESVDARRFEQLVLQGQRLVVANPERASELLSEALALWRDDPLPDFTDLEPVSREAARLDEMHQSALESWAQAELALGRHAALAPELGQLVAAYPLREQLHGQRMLALYRDGRQAEALAAFRQLRTSLDEELGIDPSSRLRQLHEQILRHDPSLDWRADDQAPESTTMPSEPAAGREHRDLPPLDVSPTNGSRTRRWTAVVGIVALALGLLSYTIVRVLKADDVTPVPPNSVAMLSANGLKGDAVPLPGPSVALVEGAGSLWALDRSGNALRRIDPETHAIQTIPEVGESPQSVAVSGNDVWVAGYDEGVVVRVSALTNTVVDRIHVGNQPAAVLTTPDGVWVANSADNTVQRIDPSTDVPGDAIQVGIGPDGLALDGTTLWVANSRGGSVTQLDTTSGQRLSSDIQVGAGPHGIAVGTADVWVANELDQSVTRINRDSLHATTIDVEDGPSSVVVSDGSAWVNNAYSGSISRIDPETNTVKRIYLGSRPTTLSKVGENVWVSTADFGSPEHEGGTLVYTTDRKFLGPTVDPASAYVSPGLAILRPVYDGLLAFRASAGLSAQVMVPDLATRIPVPSDGGKTYVFTIRKGIRYSTGENLVASDFVRGVRRALLGHGNPDLFTAIEGAQHCVDAPNEPAACTLAEGLSADDTTGRLTIRLSHQDSNFLYKLTFLVRPAPRGQPLTDGKWDVIVPSTGPYMLSQVGADGSFTLTRNPYFHQWSFAAQPKGYPDEIRYRVAPSREAGIADVLAGRTDFFGLRPSEVGGLAGHAELIHRYAVPGTQWVYLNPTIPPFNNLKARQALNYAVDRETLASLWGTGPDRLDLSCQFLPPDFPGYRPYCPYQTGPPTGPYAGPDVARAQDLVRQSGTAETPIVLRAFRTNPVFGRFPAYIAQVMRSIGYSNVSVVDIPEDAPDALSAGYQIFTGEGWFADYPNPQTFYDIFTCNSPDSISHYCNPAIDALAAKAAAIAETDSNASLDLWSQVDRMLTDDGAFVTLGRPHAAVLVSSKVKNLELSPLLGPVLSQMWVK